MRIDVIFNFVKVLSRINFIWLPENVVEHVPQAFPFEESVKSIGNLIGTMNMRGAEVHTVNEVFLQQSLRAWGGGFRID